MNRSRAFRFGILTGGAASRGEWTDKARHAEALGYSTLLIDDHLYNPFAPLTALVSAADATTSLRIGSLVFGNDFRHPVVLAREAATLDILTDGRFELGLGTGYRHEDMVIVTDQRRQAAEQKLRDFEMPTNEASVDGILASPGFLFGTIEQIVEDLQARRQRYGFSYIAVGEYFQADVMERFSPVVARLTGI